LWFFGPVAPLFPSPSSSYHKINWLEGLLSSSSSRRISQYTHTFKHANGNPRDEVEKDIFDLNRVSEKKDEI